MKNFFNYVRYSNLNVSLSLNPFTWGFKAFYDRPTDLDPKCHFFCLHFLALRVILVIDDGSY